MKEKKKLNSKDYTNKQPNEQHRAERWSGAQVHRSKKLYRRKSKYKPKYEEQ